MLIIYIFLQYSTIVFFDEYNPQKNSIKKAKKLIIFLDRG